MATEQKQFVISRRFHSSYDKSIAGKVSAALEKLMKDPTSPGLHVEEPQNVVDDRIRTARVDSKHRLVFFDLGVSLLLQGVYGHDEAYAVASTAYARVNPQSGFPEIRQTEAPPTSESTAPRGGRFYTDSELKALEQKAAAQAIAEYQQETEGSSTPVLGDYTPEQLEEGLGVDHVLAQFAVTAPEDELLAQLERVDGWQGQALLDLATGTSLDEVREAYIRTDQDLGGTDVGVPSDSEDMMRAINDPRSASQFHLIVDDEALRTALEGKSFAEWRLFLHPDQKKYVEQQTSGPFRLSGGAGTGKTVVLVHRAVRLARRDTHARVLVVSFTKNLVEMIAQQIHELAPGVRVHDTLGNPGICVMTMDQVASQVVRTASQDPRGRRLSGAMNHVLGWGLEKRPQYRSGGSHGTTPWEQAIDLVAGQNLPEHLKSRHFFVSEYSEVILPQEITDIRGYLRARRTGRGTSLGRVQRQAVWEVVEQYRREGAAATAVDWDEAAALATAVLHGEGLAEGQSAPEPMADHLLIDEGQDFSPTRWKLARAVVAEGSDDLFIAEDANQRIYGNRIVLSHYGIQVRGRSRRLRLNYRTTEQNLQWALKVLDGGSYDLDEAEGTASGATEQPDDRYLSSRLGPDPVLLTASSLTEEYDQVAELLQQWSAELDRESLDLSTLGILVRTQNQRTRLVRAMSDRGLAVSPVDKDHVPTGSPVAMTFHRAKGTEFTRVLLFDISEDSIPTYFEGTRYDEQAAEDTELRERSLLYVGATRARDMLAISWNRKGSPFLPARK